MTDLDTLARGAAADLRAATADVAPTGSVPPRNRLPMALAAAVLAVVAIAGAVLVAGGDGDGGQEVRSGPAEEAPRLVLDPPPAGFDRVERIADGVDAGAGMRSFPTVTVYGDPAAEHPFASADLAVSVVEEPGADIADRLSDSSLGPVDVGGRPGALLSVTRDPGGHVRLLTLVPAPDVLVTLTSASLTEDELVRIGAGLTLDGLDPVLSYLPPGLEAVASVAEVGSGPSVLTARRTAAAWLVRYADTADAGLLVGTFTAGDAERMVSLWALGPAAEPVEVRGRPGWRSADGRWVLWEERPGVTGVVWGSEPATADQVDDAVAALAEADAATWEALGERAEEGVAPQGDDTAGAGSEAVYATLPDGTEVSVEVRDGEQLCIFTGPGAETCHSVPLITDAQLYVPSGATAGVVYGSAPAGVEAVEVMTAVDVDPHREGLGGVSLFAVPVETGGQPVHVTYLDDTGTPLTTYTLTPW